MIQEISKKLERIYVPITIVLCWLLNIGAVCPNTSECSNPVVDQQKDEELEWNWVVKPGEYEECLFLGDGLIAVKKKSGCFGIVDQSGNFVFPNEYDEIGKYCEGLARVREQGNVFFINRNGNRITDRSYQDAHDFQEGKAAVMCDNDLWGFINGKGEIVIDCKFCAVNDFSGGLAAVQIKNKWGFIDNKGQEDIACMYDDAGDFSEGKAAVKTNNYFDDCIDAWAYIDQNNKIVIEYDSYTASEGRMGYVGSFKNGFAFVSDVFYSIIDDEGRHIFDGQNSRFIISSLEYNEKYDAIPGYIYVDDAMTIKKYGLVGLNGIQRLEPVFDYVHGIFDDYVLISQKAYDGWSYGVIELSE